MDKQQGGEEKRWDGGGGGGGNPPQGQHNTRTRQISGEGQTRMVLAFNPTEALKQRERSKAEDFKGLAGE